jgi:hypothetical protein
MTAPTKARPPFPSVPGGLDPKLDEIRSVFDGFQAKLYRWQYDVQLTVDRLVGGTPTDPNVTEGWIRTKMGVTSDDAVSAAVAEVMSERAKKGKSVTAEEAMDEVARNRNLSGFKRNFATPVAKIVQERATTRGVEVLDRDGQSSTLRTFTQEQAEERFGELFIEGRQVKAMIKEAAMIAVGAGHLPKDRWGKTGKGLLNFLSEHLFVDEDEILLGVTDPTLVNQSFVHTFRGSGIKLEEILAGAVVDFRLLCDYDFEATVKDFFPMVFTVAQQNGLGASRSQGFGRFKVTKFEKVPPRNLI